jgi:phage terminase large subunit-like protein
MSSDQWSRTACLLAHEIDANDMIVERNYGGDSAKLILRTQWKVLQDEGLIPADSPCPRIVEVHAKKGKRVRAEPISAQVILGKVKFHALAVLNLASEWQTWQEDSSESPGRIDASCYLAYRWLKIPGSESLISTIAGDQTPKTPTGQGELAQIRVARPVGGR